MPVGKSTYAVYCAYMKRYNVCVCVLYKCLCVRLRLPFPKLTFPEQYLGDFNLQDLKGPGLHPVPFSWPWPAAGCTCSPCRGSRGRVASAFLIQHPWEKTTMEIWWIWRPEWIYIHASIHNEKTYTYTCLPGSARHAPGRKSRKRDMAIGTSWLVGILGELERSE